MLLFCFMFKKVSKIGYMFHPVHQINKIKISPTTYFKICRHKSDKVVVKINDISIKVKSPKNVEYVPKKYLISNINPETLRHLRWMMQKDILGQDMFLLGSPGLKQRNLALAFLELTQREVEFIALSRDTTEADLKQRKEIKHGTAYYYDQSAVRAAINGRILILEGIEKVERNVLPILNNLLENREMHLEDGRFLIPASRYDKLLMEHNSEELQKWRLVRVSEDFRVIALGLPVPRYSGYPLDPPLRSRFQARHIPPTSYQVKWNNGKLTGHRLFRFPQNPQRQKLGIENSEQERQRQMHQKRQANAEQLDADQQVLMQVEIEHQQNKAIQMEEAVPEFAGMNVNFES